MIPERPYTLIAEVTYRCPLQCVYCSNPVSYGPASALDTDTWRRALQEAEELGVVQVHFTGGEPLLRDDLEQLIQDARRLTLYTSLITSGVPLDRTRLIRLQQCGLDSVQLSLQAAEAGASARIAGAEVFGHKLAVAGWVKALGLPLTINVVLHRHNIEDLGEIIALAERLGADRLELANTQYLGWALRNRQALLPTRAQLEAARGIAQKARQRLQGRMEVIFVIPDYYADLPRRCMDGWGRCYLVITPDGLVLPCHAAHTVAGLHCDNIRNRPLREIWSTSDAFVRFRGTGWMPPPCQTCERRLVDFGGCRCQAFHLTGDPTATDPACHLSPAHHRVQHARADAETGPPIPVLHYRTLSDVP